MRGRWAAGIVPRNFTWIITDRLAVSERPGGYSPNHRPVRRQEEILWLKGHGFTRVVSLLGSRHNLHAYEEKELAYAHFPLSPSQDPKDALALAYPALLEWLRAGERVLVHQEELGERVGGVIAGFLYWSGLVPDQPRAIAVVEQLLRRQIGAIGRSVVAACSELAPPSEPIVVSFDRLRSDELEQSGAIVELRGAKETDKDGATPSSGEDDSAAKGRTEELT